MRVLSILALTFFTVACAAVPADRALLSTSSQGAPLSLGWSEAVDQLRAGRFVQVIETDSDVVWFVDPDGVYAWATKPKEFVWSDDLLLSAKFDRVIVD